MNVGPSPAQGALDRLARRLVHRQHVVAVHPHARHPVAGRLGRERLGARLLLHRRRDGPAVVAEQDRRRAHDCGEVGALVKRALRGRAVAEVGDRDGLLPAQPLAPREADRVRHVRPDRHADRGDVVVGRVPPAGRMPAPPLEHRRRRHPRAAVRSPTRGSWGRSSRRPPARAPSRPESPRAPSRWRRCRCAPGCGRRPSARRRCAGGRASGRAPAALPRRARRPPRQARPRRRRSRAVGRLRRGEPAPSGANVPQGLCFSARVDYHLGRRQHVKRLAIWPAVAIAGLGVLASIRGEAAP